MIKSVHAYPLSQLMNIDDSVVYRIPRYQREYKWGKTQWEDLFDDIFDSDISGYFLGSIICINQTTDTAAESVLEVVDGQQRLTTLSLLLSALYSSLRARRDQLNDEQFVELINLKHKIVLKKDRTKTRIVPQHQNNNQIDYLAVLAEAGLLDTKPKVSNLGNRKIKRAFRYFEEQIEDRLNDNSAPLDELLKMIQQVSESVLVKIEVASHSDAYVLFESLNNRGMPLTPIDLIKNKLLATMETRAPKTIDVAFDQWTELLDELGDNYPNQERFFRHYYNAFRQELVQIVNVPVATKSNLIRVYEALIESDPRELMMRIVEAGELYSLILNRRSDESTPEVLCTALRRLERAQGAPSYLLILFLLSKKSELDIDDHEIAKIVNQLVSFFVRRNLTGVPQTYELQRMFMSIVEQLEPGTAAIVNQVSQSLTNKSASDAEFRSRLAGPIYEDNVEACRFILAMLAERDMTKETFVDLWAREGQTLAWTVEHIFPQGTNIPQAWIENMGGSNEAAKAVQGEVVHTLGNLTITRFNANLSNKSFIEKRDRTDSLDRYIGYKNGLSLNKFLAAAETWTAEMIRVRTDRMVDEVIELFPLE